MSPQIPPLDQITADATGLPDTAALARLASQMFAEALGHGPRADSESDLTPHPDGSAASPDEAATFRPDSDELDDLRARPRGAKTTGHEWSPSDMPGTTAMMPPQPATPPTKTPLPVPLPTTPYYFIGESSALAPGLEIAPDAAPVPSLGPLGTPGTALTPPPIPAAARGVEFYFVDSDRPTGVHTPWSRGGHGGPFDVLGIRRDFPILAERVNGRNLVWLDNAATTQKPQAVIDRLSHFYRHENSNVHRAAHELAARSTDAYEGARSKVARFLGASSDEVVFVRGTTEAINLVAQSWGRSNVGVDDEIIISHLEHHANIVPWQQLVAETGAKLRVIPVDDRGQILLAEYYNLLNDRTRLVAVAHVSNALGTVLPIEEVIKAAHGVGARVLIDGAQAVSHIRVDMKQLDPDFYVMSGHKLFAPTGIGALYGKADVLESMPPWQGGGSMICDVTLERSLFQDPPARFEAGTGSIADAVGLGAAVDYLERIGLENVARHEHDLLSYATEAMQSVPGLHMIGTAPSKVSVLSFILDGYRPEDVGSALNREGIAVRAGHHCAQPILRRYGLEATVRASLALYNTYTEVDLLVAVLHRLAANAGVG